MEKTSKKQSVKIEAGIFCSFLVYMLHRILLCPRGLLIIFTFEWKIGESKYKMALNIQALFGKQLFCVQPNNFHGVFLIEFRINGKLWGAERKFLSQRSNDKKEEATIYEGLK